MKGGKKKNGGSADTLTAPSNGVLELVAGEAQQQQQDAGGEEEPVAGEEEEEEETYEVEGEGEGDDNNEKPKLAEGYYEIEAVRQKRIRKGQVQYLIKWRGWPETENTWEPVKNLMSCSDVIDAFEESLQSGKQRSTRKRKRKSGATHTPVKRKQQQQPQQQQRSPAAATYDVPAVRVRIIEEPTPSPPLSGLKATNRGDSNDSDLNNNKVGRVVIGNGLTLGSSLEETREQNELNLKLSELKGAVSTNDNSVERSGNGLSNGFPKANGVESFQSDRCTGAKKRKRGSVRRFKQDTASVMDDIQDAAAVGPMATFVQEGSHNHEFMGSDLVCKNKFDDSGDEYTITQIVKPISYSASLSSDMQDVSITFQAKRSDGKDMMVDNKFLKMNNPLLLINFYEQHLRYQPTQ